MRQKRKWSIVSVCGEGPHRAFFHGRHSFLGLWGSDIGGKVQIIVLRQGRPFDKGATVVKEERVLFSGLEHIRPYEFDLASRQVFSDADVLKETWFQPGETSSAFKSRRHSFAVRSIGRFEDRQLRLPVFH